MVSIMEIMQLCRLCLVKEQVNIPIFEDQGDIRQIYLKITACLPVKVSKEDKLPKNICDGCLYKLELLYQFRNSTANAEKQLLTWIKESDMEVNSKSPDEFIALSQPQEHTVKQEKVEPTESTNDSVELSTDAQSYILQQQQLSYQADFPFKESQGSNADSVDLSENLDEPLSKRRRRRQATKPVPPESLDSSENEATDSLLEMTVTKTEEESESNGDENIDDSESVKFAAVSTEDTDQPGPSGLGKGSTEAPNKGAQYKRTTLRKCSKTYTINQSKSKNENNSWFCKKCDKHFTTRKSLRDHRKEVHSDCHKEHVYNYIYNKTSNTYTCKTCDLELELKHKMEEHVLTHEEKFICEECNEILYSAYKYCLHVYAHSGDGIFKCPLCKYNTPRRSSVLQHINTIHLRKYLYYCKHCGKGFHDVVTYREHENLHISFNTITCIVCNKEFSFTRNLVLHQTRYHRVTTIDLQLENQCNICKKSYSKKSTLKNHMKTHDSNAPKVRPHLCEWCGKDFNDKSTLNHHNRIHTGYKPYKCSYCEKAFSKKGYLILHERTHSGEKPYCCLHCGKCFNQLTSLKVHIRSHTGERPYSCHICNHRFTSKTALKNHTSSCFG